MHRSELKTLGFRTLSPAAHRTITERAEGLKMAVSDYLRYLVKLDCSYRLVERFQASGDVLETLEV